MGIERMSARLVRRSLLVVPVTCAFGLAVAQPSFATTSFTWSGGDASPGWSLANNWVGGTAPTPSDTGDALVFPAVPSGGDCSGTQSDACYDSQVDKAAYPITGITIDDGVGYRLSGTQTLTLGTGGITADTSSSLFDPATITDEVALGTGQTWTVDGGSSGEGELALEGVLAGLTEPLTIDLGSVGYLDLTNSSDNVGDVTIAGTDSSKTGASAYQNGALALDPSGGLNASDGNPIQLTDASIYGNGSLGPVTSTGGELAPGTRQARSRSTGSCRSTPHPHCNSRSAPRAHRRSSRPRVRSISAALSST